MRIPITAIATRSNNSTVTSRTLATAAIATSIASFAESSDIIGS